MLSMPASAGWRTPIFSALLMMVAALLAPTDAHPQEDDTYSTVEPIFRDRCVMCHTGPTAPVGLKLDSLEAIMKGSNNGPVAIPGDPARSELVHRIKGTSLPRMPMTGPPFLSDDEILAIEAWIAAGMPEGETVVESGAESEAARPRSDEPVTYADVAPILATRCAKCHTDGGLLGPPPEDFRLTSYEATISASDRARVVPGIPDASELVRRIRGQSRPRMPMDGPPYLDAEEIQLVESWIEQGARDSRGIAAAIPVSADVRLHGTLSGRTQLDGLNLVVGPNTRMDDTPVVGAYVQVRGTLDETGQIVVERIRRR